MEEDILEKVIEVESEIHKRLEDEKNRSLQRIEEVKKAAEQEILDEEARLKESLSEELKNATLAFEKKKAETLTEAQVRAKKIEDMSDDVLKSIVRKHIFRILPGGKNDRQDVKG
jgi:vacuolar-type H+-ATPase subunit H